MGHEPYLMSYSPHTGGSVGPWDKFCSDTKKLTHFEIYSIRRSACQKLNTNAAEELRYEVYRALRYSHPQAQSEERRNEGTETTEIREEPDVLTADKGVAML